MNKELCTRTLVGEYLDNGFHCAEAVAAAVLESRGADPSQALAHATPFGGGMGRTFGETCGALTGGLIAIGHLHGRTRPGEGWDKPASLARELRERFLEAFGETQCLALRERFGERQSEECAHLVEWVADRMDAVLRGEAEVKGAPCACCCGPA